jgi:hypothetical protein
MKMKPDFSCWLDPEETMLVSRSERCGYETWIVTLGGITGNPVTSPVVAAMIDKIAELSELKEKQKAEYKEA